MSTPDPRTTTASGADVRVRFCPSPTGLPHVGLIRTVLFNWAYARHNGGTLVFRIEDTDAARDSEESYQQLLDALRWLEIDWDEGVEVGGPHAPYRQSQRHDIYFGVLDKLKDAGAVYESYSTPEEIDARNEANGRAKQLGYDNFDRDLSDELGEHLAVQVVSLRLPVGRVRAADLDALVPVDLEPPQRVEQLQVALLAVARGIRVFDAEHELAAVVARIRPVEEHGADESDVRQTRR